MNEKTKNILSWVLSILIVGSIITSFVIDPYNSLICCLLIAAAIIALVVLGCICHGVKHLMYEIVNSRKFQRLYRRYVNKHYESREHIIYQIGSEVCLECSLNCKIKDSIHAPYQIKKNYCEIEAANYAKRHGLTIDEDCKD